MNIAPTSLTAALSGMFSGLTWPLIWPLFQGNGAADNLWLMLATIVLVAFPAHVLVLGLKRRQEVSAGVVDSALLVRVGTWIACAACAAVLVSFRALAF